ncbi:hypothetical protein J2S10_004943 [Neobacillus ginsengisoli]|uniref:Uncharacterized protein n=1 Tax=Neobacillus ginsengisoli TaxID=904295 RepID=A0ABT9Y263_9BACI|nr:hypothetical protein [Neobacillus ginsengisoli]
MQTIDLQTIKPHNLSSNKTNKTESLTSGYLYGQQHVKMYFTLLPSIR